MTVNTSCPPALVIADTLSVWVCIASTVTTTTVRSKHARRFAPRGSRCSSRRPRPAGARSWSRGRAPRPGVATPFTGDAHAAQALAIDRDHPPPVQNRSAGPQPRTEHPVQLVGVQTREQLAQSRLLRNHVQPDPSLVLTRQVAGPPTDRGERKGPGPHGSHRDRQCPGPRIAHSTTRAG